MIEQAIFTSAETHRQCGYQLVSHSRGIGSTDLRELAAWGPSHDSLLEDGEDAVSVNFFPLPSGAYCVSKTTPEGPEYSSRGGTRIYTQCLVVPADVLRQFANNPFAVLNAAFAQGSLKVLETFPPELEPIRLAGKAAIVDKALIGQLAADPGPAWMGVLVEAAIQTRALGIVAAGRSHRLLAGLINCLPIQLRTEFSFSSGLKHSPQRPFRLVTVEDDVAHHRRLTRQYGLSLIELDGRPSLEYSATSGWGGFVSCAIATGNTQFLAEQLAARRDVSTSDLGRLGASLLKDLAQSAVTADGDTGTPYGEQGNPPVISNGSLAAQQATCLADARSTGCLHELPGISSTEVQRLGDTIHQCLTGKDAAVALLREDWPALLSKLNGHVDLAREAYVRRTLEWCNQLGKDQPIRNPKLSAAALDVIAILFDA